MKGPSGDVFLPTVVPSTYIFIVLSLRSHTKEDESIIRGIYPRYGSKLVATIIDRTTDSVRMRAVKLGVSYEGPTIEERFWDKVDKRGPDECWKWKGDRFNKRYGRYTFNGLRQGTHRVAWQIENGEIPTDQLVLHTCDNPPCCNPNHLFLGTQDDNVQDCIAKGRFRIGVGATGEDHSQTVFTNADIKEIRRLHATGLVPQGTLGKMFNVSRSNIGAIVRGETWNNLPLAG